MYQILRRILFLFPTERIHYFSMNALKVLCSIYPIRKLVASIFTFDASTNLHKKILGLNFRNPVGLAAGFDKNARYLRELKCLGFGFVEIGTVTPKPQLGNDKPRLFRLPHDKALINRMGFNNDGVFVVKERLRKWREKEMKNGNESKLIIGGNIGKNKITENENASKDYEICFEELFDYVDYFVVNVSSPNTPGLRELQEKEALRKILGSLQLINRTKSSPKPILLKIAPDLTKEQIDQVIDLSDEIKLDGMVVANTTISRTGLSVPSDKESDRIGNGGLSGLPLREKSTELLRYISQKNRTNIPLIASGGIFSGADAMEKFKAGAVLVQVWTGFIYEGPSISRKICKDLDGKIY